MLLMPQKFFLWLRALSITRRHGYPVIIVNSLPVLLLSSSTSRNSPPVLCSQSIGSALHRSAAEIKRACSRSAVRMSNMWEYIGFETHNTSSYNFGAAEWLHIITRHFTAWLSLQLFAFDDVCTGYALQSLFWYAIQPLRFREINREKCHWH